MSEKQPVDLSTRGLLGDLAAGINKTSARLVQQEAALNQRDNARATWIAGVSHDIRTPLSLVMGYASQLEDDPELPLAKREQASIIRRQSERIKTLVSNLNLASKLEYDMQPLRVLLCNILYKCSNSSPVIGRYPLPSSISNTFTLVDKISKAYFDSTPTILMGIFILPCKRGEDARSSKTRY